jgi:hypothetical protein
LLTFLINCRGVKVGLFAEQVVGDFEDIAVDRQHYSSMPYASADATIMCAKGGALGAACGNAGFHQRRAYPSARICQGKSLMAELFD